MIYDDGSTLTYDGVNVSSTPATDAGVGSFATDRREADKLAPFYPQGGGAWWEQAAMFGVTRAIDSHFKRAETDKTAQPITFAGQNGQTYAAGATTPSVLAGNGGLLLLAGVALAAFLVLRK